MDRRSLFLIVVSAGSSWIGLRADEASLPPDGWRSYAVRSEIAPRFWLESSKACRAAWRHLRWKCTSFLLRRLLVRSKPCWRMETPCASRGLAGPRAYAGLGPVHEVA